MPTTSESRRGFIKKAVYVVPAVLSLNVALVEARAGSDPMPPNQGRGSDPGHGKRKDKRTSRDTRDLSR